MSAKMRSQGDQVLEWGRGLPATLALGLLLLTISPWDACAETLGPSSRRTGLAISEIMYHPTNRTDGKNVEFIELFNSEPLAQELGGYRLSGDVDFTFPTNTIIQPNGFLVVAPSPADVQSVYGISGVLGGFTNNLPDSSGTIRLRNRIGAVLLEASYSDEPPWPAAADGAGHSLVLARPSLGEREPAAWAASNQRGGSPGAAEPTALDPLHDVVINEFLAHTAAPELDFIELYNHNTQSVNLAGCILTDDPATNRFIIPNGTTLPPRAFVSFDQTQLGFALSSAGETIFMINSNQSRVLDAVRFSAQALGVSTGRQPDGTPDFYPLRTKTPGTNNSAARLSSVVINEIMYHPISGDSDDKFVELFNAGTNTVNLGGWKFVAGTSFTFPMNSLLRPGGFLVVAANAARIRTNYANLNATNCLGNFNGNLANSGERLALAQPESVVVTNGGSAVTNVQYVVVDEVTYRHGARWGEGAAGNGSSLELRDPRSDHRRADNWADSDESAKSAWTTVEFTGQLIQGDGSSSQRLEVMMSDTGECLVDDVEVVYQGVNLVATANANLDSGLGSWTVEGNHEMTTWQSIGGTANSGCLHLRASGRGDYMANRALVGLTAAIPADATATLRAKARWLRGEPELVLRLSGNFLEAVGRLPLPTNPGTPGMTNTQATSNVGPAIFDVTHSPVLPAASQPVVVTARVSDPQGITNVLLYFRLDPATTMTATNMVDDGTRGDAVAGDGVYSVTLPGQASGQLVALRISAWDALGATNRFPNLGPVYPSDTLRPECLIRFGEPQPASGPRRFGNYHLWVAQATYNRWVSRGNANNAPLDATFVYEDQRPIYNVGALYSGSFNTMHATSSPIDPLTQSPISGYNVVFAADEPMLGAGDAALDPNARPYMAQHEQVPYWLARELDLPYCHRRYVNVFFNGNLRTVFEDAQQPSRDMVEEFYPDDPDGDLYKVEVWWATTDYSSGGGYHGESPLAEYWRGMEKNLARYRWTFQKRAALGSPSDYHNVFQLADAMSSPTAEYTAAIESVMDVEQWMRILAVERLVGNADSWGRAAPHNMYACKPAKSGWKLMMYDMDYSFYGGENPTSDLVSGAFSADAQLDTLVNHPPFLRAYLRALQDTTNGPLARNPITGRLPKVDAFLDANYDAISVVNGIGAAELSPDYLGTGWTYSLRGWFTNRYHAIETTLQRYGNPAFTVNAVSSSPSNWLTLTGTAPIEVKTITVNGVEYPVTWTSVTTWQTTVALSSGTNSLRVQGVNRVGQTLAGADTTKLVTFAGAPEAPEGNLVINEIMFHPSVADAGYIEIFNRATNTAFDVSGWQFHGADFTFPGGSVVRPGGFLVVVKNRAVFGQTYGWDIPVAGEYAGTLDNGGETLSLIIPGATGGQDRVINLVTYDDDPPWPAGADGTGASLQLIDPAQDNARVANWAVGGTNAPPPPPAPEWRHVTATGTASSSALYIYLQSAGDVYVDDFKLVAGSVPEAGPNVLTDGDFESGWPGPWIVADNHAASTTSTTIKHSGGASLHLVASSAGSTRGSAVVQDISPALTSSATYTLSYWYLPSTNGSGLTVRLSGSGISVSHSIAPSNTVATSTAFATPGATNSVRATLPAFLPVWLNEIEPDNVSGLADGHGEREPWVELFNAGTTSVNLSGCYLADNFTNLTQWPFPSNTVIAPRGFLLVWLDGEPGETTTNELHANFRAAPFDGALALAKAGANGPVVLDYLPYGEISADYSLGLQPDGQPQPRQLFYHPTPGATNDNTPAPLTVFINEWMADNRHTLADPADGDFEDWFELYNPNGVAVDLTGYQLADNLAGANRWTVPSGTVIQPQDFLLVWADSEPGQNSPTRADLHADFKLDRGGESIVLFAPNGEVVDAITFGAQATDASQGRWPNGAPEPFYSMTTPTPRSSNVIPPASLPLLRIEDVTCVGGLMTLTWTAQEGRFYRVERKAQLDDLSWQGLAGDVVSAGNRAGKPFLLPPTNACQFYRVRLLTEPADFISGELPAPRPAGVTAVAGNGRVTVSWLGSLGATGFQVKRSTSPGVHPTIFTAAASPFVDTSAQNGTTYYYVVSAMKGTLESLDSHEVSATPLAPPTSLVATAGVGRITLSWQPAAGATGYRIKRGQSPGAYTSFFVTTAPPFADLAVLDGTTYYYAVTTLSGTNESENSAEASASTPLAPPTDVAATASAGQVQLTWTPSSGATSYLIRRGTTSGVYGNQFSATTAPFVDDTVANGTTYFYVVLASNLQGQSAPSAEVSATPLAAPTGLTATPGTGSVTLTWNPSAGATSYFIKRGSSTGNYTTAFSATGTNYTDATILSNATYFFAVSAVQGITESANSAEVQVRLGGVEEFVYVDDASNLPAGGQYSGDSDSWTLVTNNPTPFSGLQAHQSSISGGLHQHYFLVATQTMFVAASDTLFCYVYLDAANMPSTLMIQWNTAVETSWDHRAYWGANLTYWGTDGTVSRRRMGDIPAPGSWVRLEVPASAVGLTNRLIGGMAFTLVGGRATWDRAGTASGSP